MHESGGEFSLNRIAFLYILKNKAEFSVVCGNVAIFNMHSKNHFKTTVTNVRRQRIGIGLNAYNFI